MVKLHRPLAADPHSQVSSSQLPVTLALEESNTLFWALQVPMYVLTNIHTHTHLNKNFAVLHILLVTIEAEEPGLQIQDQHGLQREFKATLSILDRACLKM